MAGTYYELEGKTLLVCVGAMRSGTSWLYHYLSTHLPVAVSPLKEVHFFNAKFPQNSLGDMDALALKRLARHGERKGNPAKNLAKSPAFQASIDRAQMVYDDQAYFGHFARIGRHDTQVFCDITPAYAPIGREGFFFLNSFVAKCKCAQVTSRLRWVEQRSTVVWRSTE